MADEWEWWIGSDEERYTEHCATREQAVKIACEEFDGGAWITEAKKNNPDLAQYFFADRFIEDAEDLAWEDHADPDGGEPIFDPTLEQSADLQERVRKAITEWAEHHKIVFHGFRFAAQRNTEFIAPDEVN